MINKGTGSIKRRHARNYIQEEADRRLREVVAPYQRQGLNALGVDYFEVKYYHVVRSSTVCTCQQSEIVQNYSSMQQPKNSIIPNIVQNPDAEIVIDYSRPLFGTPGESKVAGDSYSELDSEQEDFTIIDEEDPPRENKLFSTLNTCNICYRTGLVPGYELYGYDRKVLTTYDIDRSTGYLMDTGTAPHTLKKQAALGFVDFVLEVPKYFKQVSVAVRNNQHLIKEPQLTSNNTQLQLADLENNAGRSMIIRCTEEQFTHIVFEFDLGTEKVRANLSQSSKVSDWTMFDSLGNIQIILPMTITDVATSDIIYVPSKNTTFKVSDFNYLQTAGKKNLDWQVNVRVVQPQEALKSIHLTEILF